MRNTILVLMTLLALIGCKNDAVEKPANLIDEETMTNILYDLSILEAIRAQNPYGPQDQVVEPKSYIFKKYQIDSVQFAESNRYYISQIELYKKMYDKVGERINAEKKQAQLKLPQTPAANPASEAGQVQ